MQPPSQLLWRRIQEFSFDESGSGFPFTERLARDNAWSPAFTHRVVEEYRRFAFLALTAGHPVTPSDAVDQAWHLHLLYTESYWQRFCRETLGRPLHHHPTRGGPVERAKFRDWYHHTLESYRREFGEEPPADIWPDATCRFGEDIRFVRVNTHRNWILAKPGWWNAVGAAVRRLTTHLRPRLVGAAPPLVLLAATAGCGATLMPGSPVDGPTFLGLALGLWLFVHGGAAAWRWWLCGPGPQDAGALESSPDPYAVAYLAEGEVRAIDTALVSLAHRGTAEPNPETRQWRRTGSLSPDAHPWERLVHENLPEEGETSIEVLRSRLEGALGRLRADLEGEGLLVNSRQAVLAQWLPSLLAWSVPIVIGIRLLHGLEHRKPVGGLIFLGVVTIGCALAFSIRPHRSRRGKAVLSNWRENHAQPSPVAFNRNGELTPSALALAVGLYGLDVLAGTPLESSRQVLQTDRSAGGCGGGCGGGDGGCGGGCGGCGGCG